MAYSANRGQNQTIKSKNRVREHGEVFTSEREVNAMLDLVKQETERIDSRFLEPACGDGNFLAEILRRKLEVVRRRYRRNPDCYERYAVIAVSSIYGVDLLQDNVDECRLRMFEIFDREYTAICKAAVSDEVRSTVRFILSHNILCGDALTMKQGNGAPIIFSEWSSVGTNQLKRRDFRFDHLLEENTRDLQLDLFGELGEYSLDNSGAAVLSPIHEYPPIDYRKVGQYE